MKPLILYYSKTGNTEKILSGLMDRGDIDLILADEVAAIDLKGRSLVGLASGIYWGKHHRSLFRAAKKIAKGSRVFLISSSGFKAPFLIKVYTFLLKLRLNILNLDLVGEWHCPGHDKSKDPLFGRLALSKGRPNNSDFQDFDSFMKKIVMSFDGSKQGAHMCAPNVS